MSMALKRQITILLLLLLSFEVHATDYCYDYNDFCRKAYESFMALRLWEGHNIIDLEIKKHPGNLMAVYIADYEDCLLLLMNCNKQDYKQRNNHLNERIAQLNRGDDTSPWYRFCKAGIYLHWALINLRLGDNFKAANDFDKSYILIKENSKLFPGFEYNDMFSGLENAVVGSLPQNYKWLANIFGIKGDVKKGTGQLSGFLKKHSETLPLMSECKLYYIYTRFYFLSEKKQTWESMNTPVFNTKDNLLNVFVKASIALDYRKSDDAIKLLQSAALTPSFNDFPIFNYQMGVALLSKLDPDCVNYFLKYLNNNKSDLYIKDTWHKTAYFYYLSGKQTLADSCITLARTRGSARIDVDKQAKRTHYLGNKELLRAHLEIEGGYYTSALNTLHRIDVKNLTNPSETAEYYYRLGDIYEQKGENKKALDFFQSAISTGKDMHDQFAARALLHEGLIYENLGKKQDAIQKYNECLDMPPHDFQNSIDQQAKAGINRLSENWKK